MKRIRKQTLDGNVETLILAVLEAGPNYGYAIVRELNTRAKGVLQLGEGTIYPVLHRMEDKRLISSSWRVSENGRERKYYRLTVKGRRALAANCQQWRLLTLIMKDVLGPAAELSPGPEPKGAII
ncbi:MAG: PadR family transcriptional regulator [Planctomycetota bacterium]|jgi:PadR family transcriptional regulator PadR